MKQLGFARIAHIHFVNYLWIMLRGRPATNRYEDVR